MPRNTLYSLVGIMTQAEIKELQTWLQTRKAEHSACLNALCLHLKAVRKGTLSKEELFTMVYPGEPFSDTKIRRLKSDMCRQLEEFLVEKELRADEKTHHELLARALFRRKDYDLFSRTVHQRLRQLDEQPRRGKAYSQEKAHHLGLLLWHPETEKLDPGNTWLAGLSDQLQRHFALSNLEVAAERCLARRHLAMEVQDEFAEACLAFAAGRPADEALRVLSDFYKLYQDNRSDPALLQELKTRLFANLHLMDDTGKRMALKLLSNFPVRMTNQGVLDYSSFMFELFRKAADEGLLMHENGAFDAGHFVNIFIAACKAGEHDWAESLFSRYIAQVPAKDRPSVSAVCQASLLYQKACASRQASAYLEVLRLTGASPGRKHWRYNVRLRSMAVRACYELFFFHSKDYADELEKQLKNFDAYLHKGSSLEPGLPRGYLNFNRQLRGLYRLASNPATTRHAVAGYLRELAAEEPVQLRSWLQQAAQRLSDSLRR